MRITSRYEAVPPEVSRARADDLLAWLRDYAGRRLNTRLIDERRTIPPYVALDLGNHGVFGVQVEERYGGLALRNLDVARVGEQLAAIDLGLAIWMGTSVIPGIRPIAIFGGEELKSELLPLLASGRVLGAYAQTEAGAGADFTALQTRAALLPDGAWSLSGDKVWVGNGSWAQVINIFGYAYRPDGKSQGLTAFAVRTGQPGVVLGPEKLSMGMRGMVQSGVSFREVRVEPSHVLGRPGDGIRIGADAMTFTRFIMGAAALGGMKRCLQLLARFAWRRSIATGRLLDNPATLARVGRLAAQTAACEALVYAIADLLDSDRGVSLESVAALKIASSEFLWDAADGLVQVLGSRGYDEANIAPQILRDARVLRIFEGPTETLLAFLGARASRPSSAVDTFLRTDVGDAVVADRLSAALSDAAMPTLRPGVPLPEAWRQHLAGDAVVWAMLLACLRRSLGQSSSPTSPSMIEWVNGRFEQVLRTVVHGSADEGVILSPQEATGVVAGYANAIGDVEQTLPGEDWGPDEMLLRDGYD